MKLKSLNWIVSCAIALGTSMSLQAQVPVELAIRLDDLGAFHSVNKAAMDIYHNGLATSMEVIPVGQWFPEAAKFLNANPGIDVGIHLAFTSEWENAKWRPLTNCPSLVDENGYFLPMMKKNAAYPGLSFEERGYNIKEVEQELRAQIEFTLKNIPQANHLTGHMGSTNMNDELCQLAQRLAEEYGLTLIDGTREYQASKNFYFSWYEGGHKSLEQKEESFIKMLRNLSLMRKNGIRHMWLDHPAYNDSEMENIFHIGYEDVAVDRQGVVDLLKSQKVKDAIKELNITLIPVSALTTSLPREKNKEMAAAIDKFYAQAQAAGVEMHSIMVLQHGKVIGERWFNGHLPTEEHIMNSASKTFTSTAAGLAISEGKLKLTDKVISFFPDKLPAKVSDNLKQMTIKDLLTMTCGQAKANTTAQRQQEYDWVEAFLKEPVPYKPGTYYAYNGLGTYMISACVQKALGGEKIFDYLNRKLFRPMGITGISWLESPQGINTGGWGVYCKTEDLAKMGQLYLQKGMWNGKQLLPASWVEEASTRKVNSENKPEVTLQMGLDSDAAAGRDWIKGYGYQIWRHRYGSYMASGAAGQYFIVVPGKDAVIALTANTEKMPEEVDLMWENIYPVLK